MRSIYLFDTETANIYKNQKLHKEQVTIIRVLYHQEALLYQRDITGQWAKKSYKEDGMKKRNQENSSLDLHKTYHISRRLTVTKWPSVTQLTCTVQSTHHSRCPENHQGHRHKTDNHLGVLKGRSAEANTGYSLARSQSACTSTHQLPHCSPGCWQSPTGYMCRLQ